MLTYIQAQEPKSEEPADIASSPPEEEKKEEESPSTEDTPQVEPEIAVSFLNCHCFSAWISFHLRQSVALTIYRSSA